MNDNILVIGIAGGTGSGKTTLMRNLIAQLGDEVTVLSHDSYYKRHDDLTLEQLRRGKDIDCPVYDFSIHNRTDEVRHVEAKKVIIVEGILIFENQPLRDLMDIRIFVDTDADVRLCRRIKRDVSKRGRTLESVLLQYQQTVKPMHEMYVQPSKRYADIVVPEGGKNVVALDMIMGRIQRHLREAEEEA